MFWILSSGFGSDGTNGGSSRVGFGECGGEARAATTSFFPCNGRCVCAQSHLKHFHFLAIIFL